MNNNVTFGKRVEDAIVGKMCDLLQDHIRVYDETGTGKLLSHELRTSDYDDANKGTDVRIINPDIFFFLDLTL
jgi:hypothetical protein